MKIYLYVQETLADWEIAFLTPELHSRRYFKNKAADLSVITVGKSLEVIHTMGGISIRPDITIDELRKCTAAVPAQSLTAEDMLILPGADTWLQDDQKEILLLAKQRIESGRPVAAICGATAGLAAVGALNTIRHTSNDKEFLKMICPDYAGEHLYQDGVAHTEGTLITASGLAPIEFTYEILQFLDVFSKETLDAWYALYMKKEASAFYDLMRSVNHEHN